MAARSQRRLLGTRGSCMRRPSSELIASLQAQATVFIGLSLMKTLVLRDCFAVPQRRVSQQERAEKQAGAAPEADSVFPRSC